MTSDLAPEASLTPRWRSSGVGPLRFGAVAVRRPTRILALVLVLPSSPFATAAPLPPPRPRDLPPTPATPLPAPPTPLQPSPSGPPADEACLAGLRALGLDAEAVSAPAASRAECVIDQPVRLRSLRPGVGAGHAVSFPDQPVVACRFAERFGRWAGELAAVLVRGQLGTDLSGVRTGVGFECRNRNRATSGKLSAHALGLAVDVAGLELASGDRLLVTEGQDRAKMALLSALRTASCGWFTTILGPGTDASHADHWHLDIQRHGSSDNYRLCQ